MSAPTGAPHIGLVVLPTDVVDAVDGCSASDAGVGSMVIVVVQPGVVAGGSLLV